MGRSEGLSMFELFTIGHSVHPVEHFMELLRGRGITALCDVRSSPYSRFVPRFNRESIKAEAVMHGIAYLYLGAELGPRSPDPSCYESGQVQYKRLAAREIFQQGLGRLRKVMETHHIALMCAEKDPLTCHRMILICRNLAGDDIVIRHILEDGSLEDNQDAEKRLMKLWNIAPGGSLFHRSGSDPAGLRPPGRKDRLYAGGKIGTAFAYWISVKNHDKCATQTVE